MTTWSVLSRNSGSWASSASQATANASGSVGRHAVAASASTAMRWTLQRPDEPDAALDAAVVEHEAGRRHLHGRAVRLAVEEQPAAALRALLQGVGERQRLVAVAPGDGEHLRRRAGARMGVDRAPLDDEATPP